jgi:hypothetical protein
MSKEEVMKRWILGWVLIAGMVHAAPCLEDECLIIKAPRGDPGGNPLQGICRTDPLNPLCGGNPTDPLSKVAKAPPGVGTAPNTPGQKSTAAFRQDFSKAKSLFDQATNLANNPDLRKAILLAFFANGTPIAIVGKSGMQEMRAEIRIGDLQDPRLSDLAALFKMALMCKELNLECAGTANDRFQAQLNKVDNVLNMAQTLWNMLNECILDGMCNGIPTKDRETLSDAMSKFKGSPLDRAIRTIIETNEAGGNLNIPPFECPSPGAGKLDLSSCVDPFTAADRRAGTGA